MTTLKKSPAEAMILPILFIVVKLKHLHTNKNTKTQYGREDLPTNCIIGLTVSSRHYSEEF